MYIVYSYVQSDSAHSPTASLDAAWLWDLGSWRNSTRLEICNGEAVKLWSLVRSVRQSLEFASMQGHLFRWNKMTPTFQLTEWIAWIDSVSAKCWCTADAVDLRTLTICFWGSTKNDWIKATIGVLPGSFSFSRFEGKNLNLAPSATQMRADGPGVQS